MDCCYYNDCEKCSATPVFLTPCTPVKRCENTPLYVPCSPCNERQIVYCCEQPQANMTRNRICYDGDCDDSCRRCNDIDSRKCCPTCHRPTTPPAKTKYVMPCYRYEDGRIEQYVPKVHGRLPVSVYKRNGIQDQVNGYRGAVRYLCAVKNNYKHFVCALVEPIKKVQSMPVTAFKRNGMQDQAHSKTLGTPNFICRHPNNICVEYHTALDE